MAHQSDLPRPFTWCHSCSMFGFCLLFKIYSCDWMTMCVFELRAFKKHTNIHAINCWKCVHGFLSLTTHCRISCLSFASSEKNVFTVFSLFYRWYANVISRQDSIQQPKYIHFFAEPWSHWSVNSQKLLPSFSKHSISWVFVW